MGILKFFQSLCRLSFGDFEKEEFKKFIKMGVIFALMIGIYWTLRPLKDAVFMQIVDKLQLPFAKTFSLLVLLPMVMFYTKLISRFSKEKMLIVLPLFYGALTLGFSALMLIFQGSAIEIAARSLPFLIATKMMGYLFYVFVESFGSLVIALFWAFATDTTVANSAKRGFPLVVAIGQMGGVILPYVVGGLPYRLGLATDSLSLLCLGALILLLIPLVRYFFRSTPKDLLISTQASEPLHTERQEEPGFLEGLKLLLRNRYLLGIFAANFIYEVVVTIFDFNFKLAAAAEYSGVALSHYLSVYGSSVNVVSLLCLLLGISNVTRFLGVGVALAMMPLIVGGAVLGFLSFNSLSFLFILMVGSKAINYALNGPALKQLYIPTSSDAKFKAQAWIETFGSRSSKQAGSCFNMSLAPLQSTFGALAGKSYYLMLSGCLCFPLLALWFIVALFLGKSFKKAVNTKSVIC